MFHRSDGNFPSQGMIYNRGSAVFVGALMQGCTTATLPIIRDIRAYNIMAKAGTWKRPINLLICARRLNTHLLRVAAGPALATDTTLLHPDAPESKLCFTQSVHVVQGSFRTLLHAQ